MSFLDHNYNPFAPPGHPVLCGPGICDPFLRSDINGLMISRFSTGRFLTRDLRGGGADIEIARGDEIRIFTYGIGDTVASETGFEDRRVADESMTNCLADGVLVGRQQALMTIGLAVQLGTPYCPQDGTQTEFHHTWLLAYEKRIRQALAESVSLEMRFGNCGILYRLGSLLSHGSTFGPMQGEAPPMSPSKVGPRGPCGAQLKYRGETFATCALDAGHRDRDMPSDPCREPPSQHRDGTIIWNDEGANELADRKPRMIDEPKAFSPFLLATMLSDSAAYGKVSIGLKINTAAVIGNDAIRPTRVAQDGRTRIAVPVRVWLFGWPAIVPEPIMCGMPTPR